MNDFTAAWSLDPSVTYLNHGSFGACPGAVLEFQAALRAEMEREPVDFLSGTLPARLDAARGVLAAFLGADPADLVFVANATAGVNAVLRSLRFAAGDELLVTSHTYNACRKTIDFVAARTGARVVVASLPFPLGDDDEIVAAVMSQVTPATRLALIDHVTSPTALVMPLARLVAALQSAGVDALVDGAHAPGMLPIELGALGAAYYTGNAHKWLCAPKGAAFLHVRRDRHAALHPTVISHGYAAGFHAEFDWTGTVDPSPWLSIPTALSVMQSLLQGGWPAIMARNRALAIRARELVLRSLGLVAPCPESMLGSMAAIPLPVAPAGTPAAGLDCPGLHAWFRERGIETWVHPHPVPVLRLSAQLYNDIDQFAALARLLAAAYGR
jgi:isopenicillin-N epimerase